MIGLAFALDHEAAGIVPLLGDANRFLVRDLPCITGTLNGKRMIVAIVGMGAATAARRTEILLDHVELDLLVLAGYAGAVVPELKRNAAVIAANYLSPQAEPWAVPLSDLPRVPLHSAAEVAGTPEARQALAAAGWKIVDMETAAVAAAAQRKNVPLLPIRVISDEAGDVLPLGALAASFDQEKQKPRALALLAHLATHPGEIAPFFRFVGHLGPARRVLTETVRRVLGA